MTKAARNRPAGTHGIRDEPVMPGERFTENPMVTEKRAVRTEKTGPIRQPDRESGMTPSSPDGIRRKPAPGDSSPV